ncbi:MAG: hypothetical protein QOJ16_4783, partial [Acidobacteriota bacterium]|nr:hypothetical protein [Acidobacteriota bacterium]
MQHVERWTRKHRVATLILLILFLVTAGLVASQGRVAIPVAEQAVDQPETPAQQVSAPVPQPAAVFIQRTSSAYGNVYVTVQLTPAEVSGKQADGTAEFITIGNPEAPVILRDDGGGGDAAAGDGIYTGLATVDDAQLSARGQNDQSALSANGSAPVPVFTGRVAVGTAAPSGFDLAGFNAGRSVRFDPAVVYLQPESLETGTSTGSGTVSGLASSHGLRNVTAASVTLGTNHFQDSVLMIRDLAVVQDNTRTYNPCTDGGNRSGVWTFNHLITEMANQRGSGLDPAQFAEDWLKTWLTSPSINGHTVPARSAMQTVILNNWPRINGKLDLGHSPLRLLAIDPRIDLRTTTNGGGGYNANTSGNFLDAGEARFVFGFV